MTCIVGLVHDGNVYMGGDSCSSDGARTLLVNEAKVFINDDYIFGFTTSFRMGQILRHKFKPPKIPKDEKDLHKFLSTKFTDELIKCLKENKWLNNSESKAEGGSFLLGVRGKLFSVYDDFNISSYVEGYHSVGSGSDVALGSLYSTDSMPLDPFNKLKIALDAASYHNPYVSPPYTFISSEK